MAENELIPLLTSAVQAITTNNNLLRATSSVNQPGSSDSGNGEIKTIVDTLGNALSKININKSSLKSSFGKGIEQSYSSFISKQKSVFDSFIKDFEKVTKGKGYSYNMFTGRDTFSFGDGRSKGRKNAAIAADFLTGGSSPRAIDKAIKQGKIKGTMFTNRVLMGKAIGDAATGRGFGKGIGQLGKGGLLKGLGTLGRAMGPQIALVAGIEASKQVLEFGKEAFLANRDSAIMGRALRSRGYDVGSNFYGGAPNYAAATAQAAMMGEDRETFNKRVLSFANKGLNWSNALQGIAVEKAYGIEDSASALQMYKRRTNAEAKYSGDLTKAFSGLQPLVAKTGLTFDELSKATVGVMSSIKGQANVDTINSMLGKYGGFVRSGDMDWGQVSGIYNKTQEVSGKGLLMMAHYARQGGFNFKDDSIMGQAYELRHLQDPAQRASAYGAALRGLYLQKTGTTDLSKMTSSDKAVVSEFMANSTELSGLEKLPNYEKIVNELMNAPTISKETVAQVASAAQAGTPAETAQILTGIKTPVEQMRNWLLRGTLSKGEQQSILNNFATNYRNENSGGLMNVTASPVYNTIHIDQATGKLTQTSSVPGAPVKTKVK